MSTLSDDSIRAISAQIKAAGGDLAVNLAKTEQMIRYTTSRDFEFDADDAMNRLIHATLPRGHHQVQTTYPTLRDAAWKSLPENLQNTILEGVQNATDIIVAPPARAQQAQGSLDITGIATALTEACQGKTPDQVTRLLGQTAGLMHIANQRKNAGFSADDINGIFGDIMEQVCNNLGLTIGRDIIPNAVMNEQFATQQSQKADNTLKATMQAIQRSL